MADEQTVSEFCVAKMREAQDRLAQIIAEDAAEDASITSGFHPDYFMPVGRFYTREYPIYPGKLNG